MARLGAAVVWTSVALGVGACRGERRLTADDCGLVRQRLEQAWSRDAVAAQRLADTDALTRFIGDEQRRIGESWAGRCQALIGQRVRPRDLECLAAADTIDDVHECGR